MKSKTVQQHCQHQNEGWCAACVSQLISKTAADVTMAIHRRILGSDVAYMPVQAVQAPAQQVQPPPQAQAQIDQPVPQKNLETGYVKLGDDWRGVFIRGSEARYSGTILSSVVARLTAGRDACNLPIHERLEIARLEELRDLFLEVEESNNRHVQRLKPYSEAKA